MKIYKRLFKEEDKKDILKSKDKVKNIYEKLNKRSSFYLDSFNGPEKFDGKNFLGDNADFHKRMNKIEVDRINKSGKQFGVKSPPYIYSFTSRGPWAFYVSKSLDPNDVAILIDYDKDSYIVK